LSIITFDAGYLEAENNLQLLAVVVGGGLLDLRLDLGKAAALLTTGVLQGFPLSERSLDG
jgi:hypothetical protein